MEKVKALCEVVADKKDGNGVKVGEEVRFYEGPETGGAHVKTLHIDDPAQFGTYKEGERYDVEPDEKPAPRAARARQQEQEEQE